MARDLDMGDVMADAAAMRDEFLHQMWLEFDRKSDVELNEVLYKVGPTARGGNEYSILVTDCINHIMLSRTVTTLCEGCFDRTGCDMCCPPDFDWMADAYNREAEENMLGRPLFPNEW